MAAVDAAGGGELSACCVTQAAAAIAAADFLLIACGAGLSADSGLPTFAEMTAKVVAARGEGLSYDQAACSDMMCRDPGTFYGFWFASAGAYMSAEPHEGYHILREWQEAIESKRSGQSSAAGARVPRPQHAVFAITSNIDGFLKRAGVVKPGALQEVHGSMDEWQCGGVPSGQRLPPFTRSRCGDELFEPPRPEEGVLDAGRMRYTGNPPRCPRCSEGHARPHVYLFGDGDRFVEDESAASRYSQWCAAVTSALGADPRLRLSILEVGCGLRVPSIRKRCEELLVACPSGQAELIRVNPEFDRHGLVAEPTISLKGTALQTLQLLRPEVISRRFEARQGDAPASEVPRSPPAVASRAEDLPAEVVGASEGGLESASARPVRRISVSMARCRRKLTLVCMSDTHSMHGHLAASDVPEGDILVHCGDFSKKGKAAEATSFAAYVKRLPHAAKVAIGGNHDVGLFCEFTSQKAESLLPSIKYLNNELIEVEGLRIYGTPWDRRGSRQIPEDVDVLLTHEPPLGVLDEGRGCEHLLREVQERAPRLHVFGHIHEGSGVVDGGESGTTFVNAALANNGMVSKRLDKPITVVDIVPSSE